MPESLPDPYAVRHGDTLWSLARRAGCSVADLQRWNKIADANRLQAGQTLYLSDQSAFGFSVLFLDALRAPIANLAYRLRFDTRTLNGTTGADGMTSRQVSKDANSTIAVVESGGRASFWRLNHGEGAHIPALLFERHIFSRRTKGRFDNAHPDLSWPVPYRKKSKIGEEDKRMHDGQVDADDAYGDYSSAYLRLIRAYSLDATAALEAASWGKFQILGTNYSLCGRPTPVAFVDQMCMSEAAQIGLLANFIQKKPPVWIDAKDTKKGKHPSLLESVRKKDWAMIAFNYNGPGYKTYSYDIKLRAAYEKYRSESKG
ncbi:LysM peptidoglycan-binding domain-containing protein [Rubrivivax gelatinosus]|uniref:LysM peptidoglycan-binding domain-containing protein n=1 Tax=Rubrivivax gelatinosus TaxID=28068 RepID=UPI00069491CB|nr:N-acetylmuramidase domain-containing protein [Rubrivivax gelatinosus]